MCNSRTEFIMGNEKDIYPIDVSIRNKIVIFAK